MQQISHHLIAIRQCAHPESWDALSLSNFNTSHRMPHKKTITQIGPSASWSTTTRQVLISSILMSLLWLRSFTPITSLSLFFLPLLLLSWFSASLFLWVILLSLLSSCRYIFPVRQFGHSSSSFIDCPFSHMLIYLLYWYSILTAIAILVLPSVAIRHVYKIS